MSRSFRLGLFIVSTLVILGIGVFLIGDKQLLFSSTYQLKTNFKNVVGLDPGAEVLVGGVAKGSVKRIELPPAPGGDVTVVMKMEKSTRRIIRADSVASIQTEGLLGDKYVTISFGSDMVFVLHGSERVWEPNPQPPSLPGKGAFAPLPVGEGQRAKRAGWGLR